MKMQGADKNFPGERFAVVPRPFIDLALDSPLTGDLCIHSLGHIAHAQYFHVSRERGCAEAVFIYCTSGLGEVSAGGERFTLGANQYVVLPAGLPHSYATSPSDPWTIYWIRFCGSKASAFAGKMYPPVEVLPSVYSRIEQRTDLFESIYSMLCGGLSIEKLDLANATLLYFLSSFLYVDLFSETASLRNDYAEGMVSRVTHYMNENLERNLTLGELASFAGFSVSYFHRRFVRETGHSPVDYFLRMKMNKAAVYLIKTNLSVAHIAAKLGFSNPDYFSRMFRKIVGITASGFRKENFRL